jgi:hypothetical protein
MRREMTRVNGNEFCTLEVELSDRNGKGLELSICGTAGYILTEEEASEQALEYWISFFEDSPEEMRLMGERFGTCFCGDAEKAAQFVLDSDGEYHGIDVVYPRNLESDDPDLEDQVFCCHSCGQIRNEIREYFPEVEPYFEYHLNGLSKLCPCAQETSKDLQRWLGVSKRDADQFLGELTCGTCGSKPGEAWYHEPLPQHVIDWARADHN